MNPRDKLIYNIKKTLTDYNNNIRDIFRLHQRLTTRDFSIQYAELDGCLKLVQEYCELSAAELEDEVEDEVEDAGAGAAALAVDEVEEDAGAGAAAAPVDARGISDRIVKCLTDFEKKLSTRIKEEFTKMLSEIIATSGKIKKNETFILSHILPCILDRGGFVSKEKALELLHGQKNFDTLRENYKRSSFLRKCSKRLVKQGGLERLSETCRTFLSISFLWNGSPLNIPDIVARAAAAASPAAAAAAAAASPAAAKQPPPSVSGVFTKTKSNTFPMRDATKRVRFVTIDETGFSWFDKDSREPISSIPLSDITGASAAGKWDRLDLFGVDIMHRGDGNHTFLWCESLEKQKNIIETVNALVALKKGGNKNRKTIIKYRKRRHQNKKKTHKKNANKKSTKKNIRKSKTKKNN